MRQSPRVSPPPSYHTPRVPVLVVTHADGWVEVFGERRVDAHIVVMPHVETPAGERAAEAYLGATLPRRYRDVYWPAMRRAADMSRIVRPSDLARRAWETHVLAALGRVSDPQTTEGHLWIV